MIFKVQVNSIGHCYTVLMGLTQCSFNREAQRFKKDVCQKYDFIVMFYESNYFVMVVIRNGSPFSLSAHSPDFTFFMD